MTDLMKVILEGKGALVDALNQQHFSLDEYYWVPNLKNWAVFAFFGL